MAQLCSIRVTTSTAPHTSSLPAPLLSFRLITSTQTPPNLQLHTNFPFYIPFALHPTLDIPVKYLQAPYGIDVHPSLLPPPITSDLHLIHLDSPRATPIHRFFFFFLSAKNKIN